MAERSADIADYVQYVVEQLVDNSDAVNVTEQVENDELYVDIEVDPSDRGRVIGKNGRLIRSMRVVVRAAAGRDGSTANVELLEEEEDDPGAPAEQAQGDSAEQTQGDAAGQDGAQA